MKYIELFAGCGGLSLGLDSISAKLMFANELSPMAAETYAFNFFNEDLSTSKKGLSKVKWLSSSYPSEHFARRLRENPYHYPANFDNTDIRTLNDLDGSLVVGDIRHLNLLLERILSGHHPEIDKASFLERFGGGQVDLVSGGPPCQSFSMAGMRELTNQRNTLPWEFAKFVSYIQPKTVLLENVQGILNAFLQNGEKFYAWYEVAKAFAGHGYVPLCMLVNARFVGVAQNRPRYVMLALREDLALTFFETLASSAEKDFVGRSIEFFDLCKKGSSTLKDPNSLGYLDLTKPEVQKKFKDSFVFNLFGNTEVSVRDAIADLKLETRVNRVGKKTAYARKLSTILANDLPKRPVSNHEMRANTHKVKMRFHLYQTLRDLSTPVVNEVKMYLKGAVSDFSSSAIQELSSKLFLGFSEGEWIQLTTNKALLAYLSELRTKKQTQKALDPAKPAPATLSIPDDACHFDELRTLSVREMARIQSFPDEFHFRSKVTTGGVNRRFEVPQYTQVGNAVPPLLGRALGLTVAEVLSRVEREHCNVKAVNVGTNDTEMAA